MTDFLSQRFSSRVDPLRCTTSMDSTTLVLPNRGCWRHSAINCSSRKSFIYSIRIINLSFSQRQRLLRRHATCIHARDVSCPPLLSDQPADAPPRCRGSLSAKFAAPTLDLNVERMLVVSLDYPSSYRWADASSAAGFESSRVGLGDQGEQICRHRRQYAISRADKCKRSLRALSFASSPEL